MKPGYVIALDQGTTSTRAVVFNHAGERLSIAQLEHRQYFPHPGWLEHDPMEIWRNTREAIGIALAKANITRKQVVAIGLTNQRETTVLWDRATGRPVYHAIVWQDTRTREIAAELSKDGGEHRFAEKTGLPVHSYFSATKILWLFEHVPGLRARASSGEIAFGTMDTWLLWNLTGGVDGGVLCTDVTNASRTLLFNITTLEWDDEILRALDIPRCMLPEVRSSSEIYGVAAEASLLAGVPISGILGDQQAAAFGQSAFDEGDAKNTYGTGNFLLVNTGDHQVRSNHGLLTTIAYQLGGKTPSYALEGSIAVTGALIQWLRDNLGLISSYGEIESLASRVEDNGGVVIVPAFSGLYAPYWRNDARGIILGLTRFVTKSHIARAALESIAYQTYDVLAAANQDAELTQRELRVDGGGSANALLMQFQADILGVPVVRCWIDETTSLGAAYAAGLAVGFWPGLADLRSQWQAGERWHPTMDEPQREALLAAWHDAVPRSFGIV